MTPLNPFSTGFDMSSRDAIGASWIEDCQTADTEETVIDQQRSPFPHA